MFEQPIRKARVILNCRKRRASIKEENFENTLLCSADFFHKSPLCFFPQTTGMDDINLLTEVNSPYESSIRRVHNS